MTRDRLQGTRHPSRRTWALIFGPVLLLIAAMLVAVATLDVDAEAILRDPMSTLGGPPLMGVGSVIGVLIWWTAVGVCLFTAAVLRHAGREGQMTSFLVTAGIISAVLSLDDQFLFHDELAEDLLGLRERFVVFAYVGVVAAWMFWYRRVIARSVWSILAVSLAAFTVSIVIDGLHQALYTASHDGDTLPVATFVEDSFKLLGVTAWTAYLVELAFHAVVEQDQAGSEVASPARTS
jgi:hypothetical protein